MTEFTIDITSRSLGVKLSNFGSHIGVHEVKSGSIGHKLGLIPGDILISINQSSVIDMRSDKALNLFRIQQLPFSATFERFTSQSPYSEDSVDIDNMDEVTYHERLSSSLLYLKPVPESEVCTDIEFKETESSSSSSSYQESKEDYIICINDEPPWFPAKGSFSEESGPALMDDISSSYDVEEGLFEIGLNSPSVRVELSSNCYESSDDEFDMESDAESDTNCAEYGYPESGNKPNHAHTHLALHVEPSYYSSFCSSNREYENNETTDIIKPFYRISHDYQISLELPDLPLPQQKDEYHFLCNDLFDYADIDINTKLVTNGFLRGIEDLDNMKYTDIQNLTARYLYDNAVMFREERVNMDQNGNERVLMISKYGFNYGVHSWSIQVTASDVYLQEIGVISTDYDYINFKSLLETGNGIRDASELGARAIYGNELLSCTNYYASFNDDNKSRCDKDLSKIEIHEIGWRQGDVIKCELNLRKNCIRFYLNGMKVRKLISLQNNKTWYPIVCYSGNSQFRLFDHEEYNI